MLSDFGILPFLRFAVGFASVSAGAIPHMANSPVLVPVRDQDKGEGEVDFELMLRIYLNTLYSHLDDARDRVNDSLRHPKKNMPFVACIMTLRERFREFLRCSVSCKQ